MPIISSLGALTQFKSGTKPEYSIPSQPLNVTVSIPAASPPLTQNYKLIKVDWVTPSSPGGLIQGYKIYNNTGAEVGSVSGTSNTTTLTIPLGNIDTFYTYTVTAFNPAGTSANSIASASIKSAPNPGTNLGGQIGTYVGNALVLRNATTANYAGTINYIANNMATTIYTGPYFLGDISMYTTYRTVSGGLLTAGGPFWSSTSCAGGHNTMTRSGVVACGLDANTYTGIAFASLT